jgi:hypothetical protein
VWLGSLTTQELLLMKKDILALVSDDEPIMFARVEPLDFTMLLGQRALSQKTSHTQHWRRHLGASSRQKITIRNSQHKATTTPLTYDRLFQI